jgi:hypothetical protein
MKFTEFSLRRQGRFFGNRKDIGIDAIGFRSSILREKKKNSRKVAKTQRARNAAGRDDL